MVIDWKAAKEEWIAKVRAELLPRLARTAGFLMPTPWRNALKRRSRAGESPTTFGR